MKMIHCADIHLGSKIDSIFSKEISDKKKQEIRSTFKKMVDYANDNNITVILLSGDIFDSDNPYKKDKDFFYSVIKSNPHIDFLYLHGNHDLQSNYDEEIDNLKQFSNNWKSYKYDNVTVSGIELSKENYSSLYSTLTLNKNDLNIVMMHGQIGHIESVNDINISKLKNKNIDYLALGHIHKHSFDKIDDRGIYVYSGCLEGRGFDEIGEKGFVILDITDKITFKFVPFSERNILIEEVDITNLKDAYQVYNKIKNEIHFKYKNIYRIILKGSIDFDVDSLTSDVEKYLEKECAFVDVKDNTNKRIDLSVFENDLSLRGEFVRSVMNNVNYSKEDKLKIINYGLKALSGKEID